MCLPDATGGATVERVSDVATRTTEPGAPPASVRWRWIALLAGAVLAALLLYAVGVLLPDFVTGLHHLPPSDVASGEHDPKDLWPRNAWGAAVQLAGSMDLPLTPLATVSAVGVGGLWLVLLRRRPGTQRALRAAALLVVVGSAASLSLLLSRPLA